MDFFKASLIFIEFHASQSYVVGPCQWRVGGDGEEEREGKRETEEFWDKLN